VVSAELRTFFAATAGVAGALVGLLFVAISVVQERLTAPDAAQAHRVRAAAALSAFLNALSVSLFALIPSIHIGWPTLIVALVGLGFIAASLASLVRVRQSQPGELREALFLAGLAIVFALQLVFGLRAISHPHSVDPVNTIAVLVIVCFLVGIARAWELIGGPAISVGSELRAIFRARRPNGNDDPTVTR
jgi:hypothetical protein